MGCWNGTCMITNLPILEGEKVKLLFLHKPYKDEENKSSYCYSNGIYHVGGLPIEAEYNDYGGVEEIVKDANYYLLEKYFQKYKKIKVDGKIVDEVDLEGIIEAIERGGLEVYTDNSEEIEEAKESLEGILAFHKYRNTSGFKTNDDNIIKLTEATQVPIEEYWTQPTYNFVMIRKDVWDYIVGNDESEFWKEKKDRLHDKDYYQTAAEWVDKRFKKSLEDISQFPQLYKYRSPMSMSGYAGGGIMFAEKVYAEVFKDTTSEIIPLLQQLYTELTIVESFLGRTRKGWNVVSGAGSQSQDWKSYKELNFIIEQICDQHLKDEEE